MTWFTFQAGINARRCEELQASLIRWLKPEQDQLLEVSSICRRAPHRETRAAVAAAVRGAWVRFTQVGSVTMSTAGRGPGRPSSAGHLFLAWSQMKHIISAFTRRTQTDAALLDLGWSTAACEPQRGRPTYSRDNPNICRALNLPRADWGK